MNADHHFDSEVQIIMKVTRPFLPEQRRITGVTTPLPHFVGLAETMKRTIVVAQLEQEAGVHDIEGKRCEVEP